VKSDGSIWFTDPIFGLLGNYEGYKAEPEIEPNVYRIDGATGKATLAPEGVRCDIDGNLWCGWGMGDPNLDGVMVFGTDGAPIGRIALPERCANVCFGGLKRNRLFMAASQSIYALYVNTQGALGG